MGSAGISPGNNPNWRNDAGLPAVDDCGCGHNEDLHELVGNKGCHGTLNQPTEFYPGPCLMCGCKQFRKVTDG